MRSIKKDNLLIALVDGSSGYFTLSVAHDCMGVKVPHVISINVYPEEIDAYLAEAMASVQRELAKGVALADAAKIAAKEGVDGISALALGFSSAETMREHQSFLESKGTREYREWLFSLGSLQNA